MHRKYVGALIALFTLSVVAAGCAAMPVSGPPAKVSEKPKAEPPAPAEPAAPAPEPQQPPRPAWVTPVTDGNFADLVARHKPNEMGRVLILEYHDFKDEEERWARQWENFRRDLETLYAKGYRAVNLLDYLNDTMKLPAGTSPVIFTFDDSLVSQVKLVEKDGKWAADPRSAVGIMLQFKKEHPDFGAAGTFYVNFTPVPFREQHNWQEKIRFLVENGFEVANHTIYHEDLSSLDDAGVQEALGAQVKGLRELLPDYVGSTLALPFGLWPENEQLAIEGEFEGVTYKHRAVLLVGSDPVYSLYDKRVDLMALPRVQAIESEFDRWLPVLDDHRYISDGDPDTMVVPEDMKEHFDEARLQGKQVRFYQRDN